MTVHNLLRIILFPIYAMGFLFEFCRISLGWPRVKLGLALFVIGSGISLLVVQYTPEILATITTRSGKGAPISASEYDANVNTMRTDNKCKWINNLTDTDDNISVWTAHIAATVTGVGCRCIGTCTPTLAQFSLEDRAGTAMTHTTPACATGTSLTTFQAVTDNAASQLAVGDSAIFDVDNNVDPDTDQYEICVTISLD